MGSSNLDPLSLLLAREANVVVEDAAFATELRARLEHAMQHEGRGWTPRYADRTWRERVLDRVAFCHAAGAVARAAATDVPVTECYLIDSACAFDG